MVIWVWNFAVMVVVDSNVDCVDAHTSSLGGRAFQVRPLMNSAKKRSSRLW